MCLSVAYTFAAQPDNLPALTLGLGLGAVDALEELGATGIEIKWPNDLVARDAKLGGILTEVQQNSAGAVTIVAGMYAVGLAGTLLPARNSIPSAVLRCAGLIPRCCAS